MFNNENPKENQYEDGFLESHSAFDKDTFDKDTFDKDTFEDSSDKDEREEVEFSLEFFEQHGLILASLEALRLENIKDNPTTSWGVSVIEELVAVAKKNTELAKVFHNILAKRLIEGPFNHPGSTEAKIAYTFFKNDIVSEEKIDTNT